MKIIPNIVWTEEKYRQGSKRRVATGIRGRYYGKTGETTFATIEYYKKSNIKTDSPLYRCRVSLCDYLRDYSSPKNFNSLDEAKKYARDTLIEFLGKMELEITEQE